MLALRWHPKRLLAIPIVAILSSAASHAEAPCNGSRFTFQGNSTGKDSPPERVNLHNIQLCSSGLPCINQIKATILRQAVSPAAYQVVEQDGRRCVAEISLEQAGSRADQATVEPGSANNGDDATSKTSNMSSPKSEATQGRSTSANYQAP